MVLWRRFPFQGVQGDGERQGALQGPRKAANRNQKQNGNGNASPPCIGRETAHSGGQQQRRETKRGNGSTAGGSIGRDSTQQRNTSESATHAREHSSAEDATKAKKRKKARNHSSGEKRQKRAGRPMQRPPKRGRESPLQQLQGMTERETARNVGEGEERSPGAGCSEKREILPGKCPTERDGQKGRGRNGCAQSKGFLCVHNEGKKFFRCVYNT